VLKPALGKSRLKPPHSAYRRARSFAPSGLFFPALHFATLLFPLEGKRCPTCVVFAYLGNFTVSGALLCEREKAIVRRASVGKLPRPSENASPDDLIAARGRSRRWRDS
jgi:hypothetical protein